jgi:hypothetical protein
MNRRFTVRGRANGRRVPPHRFGTWPVRYHSLAHPNRTRANRQEEKQRSFRCQTGLRVCDVGSRNQGGAEEGERCSPRAE